MSDLDDLLAALARGEERCPYLARYQTRTKALAHIRALGELASYFEPYRCPQCRKWHIACKMQGPEEGVF